MKVRHTTWVGLLMLLLVGCGGEQPVEEGSGSGKPDAAKPLAAPAVDVWTAVVTGNVEVVKLHLESGTDPNIKDPNGAPILNAAAVFGHRDVVAALLEQGANINGKDNDGNGALHAAAFLGRTEVVELLLEKGVDANFKNNKGETPTDSLNADWGTTQFIAGLLQIQIDQQSIQAGRNKSAALLAKRGGKVGAGAVGGAAGGLIGAIRKQDAAEVKKILADKVDLNAPDQQLGMTPLAWAAAVGNVEIAGLLLERGAQVDGKNGDGATPLHVASFLGRAGVVELLLAKKGDPNARNTKGETPLVLAQVPASLVPIVAGALRLEVDQNTVEQGRPKVIELLEKGGAKTTGVGGSKLIAAIRKQDVAAVKQALADKADPNGQDPEFGVTALNWATMVGNVEIARILLDGGADVNGKSRDGGGPLSGAAFMGRADVCELLISSGGDPKLKNAKGEDPLFATTVDAGATQFVAGLLKLDYDLAKVQAGRAKCVQLLKNGTGAKELCAAVRKQDVAAVKLLLAKPTNPNAQDPDFGITALAWAAFHGNLEIAGLLIAGKADVNGKNRDDSRPLHAAAFTGHSAVLELLLSKGADAAAKNSDDETPVQSTEADPATTRVLAGLLQLKLDTKALAAGRARCIELLKKKSAAP
jgi:ankyrin repeat protein